LIGSRPTSFLRSYAKAFSFTSTIATKYQDLLRQDVKPSEVVNLEPRLSWKYKCSNYCLEINQEISCKINNNHWTGDLLNKKNISW